MLYLDLTQNCLESTHFECFLVVLSWYGTCLHTACRVDTCQTVARITNPGPNIPSVAAKYYCARVRNVEQIKSRSRKQQ